MTTESRTPVVSPLSAPRFRAIASISSRMITWSSDASPAAAHSASAGAKSSRTFFSASPTNLSMISGPLTICARARRASARAAREERLAAARRAGEQDAAHVRDAEPPRRRRVGARREHAPHDRLELRLEVSRRWTRAPPRAPFAARRRRRRRRRRWHRRRARRRRRRRDRLDVVKGVEEERRRVGVGLPSGGIAASVLDGWVSWRRTNSTPPPSTCSRGTRGAARRAEGTRRAAAPPPSVPAALAPSSVRGLPSTSPRAAASRSTTEGPSSGLSARARRRRARAQQRASSSPHAREVRGGSRAVLAVGDAQARLRRRSPPARAHSSGHAPSAARAARRG